MEETAKFALMFDQFFDMLNVTNFTKGSHSRKSFLHPYRHKDDHRLCVCIHVHLLKASVIFLC